MIRAVAGSLAGHDDLSAIDLEEGYGIGIPSLRANIVISLDGVVALDGVSGALGGPADKEVFATLRALSDVVIVGAGTVRAEDYGPAWLSPARRGRRIRRGQPPLPPVAVLTSNAGLDPDSRLFTEVRDDQPAPPRPYVFTSEAAPPERVEALARVATVVALGPAQVDPAAMLAYLAGHGLGRGLCEGGPGLLTQLVAAGLVDDLCLTTAALMAGPGHRALAGDPAGVAWASSVPFRLLQLLEADGLLLARYGRDAATGPEGRGPGSPR